MGDRGTEGEEGTGGAPSVSFKKPSFKKASFKKKDQRERGGSAPKGGMRRKRARDGSGGGENNNSSSDDGGGADVGASIVAGKRTKKGVNSFRTDGRGSAEARAATREALAKEVMSANRFDSTRTTVPVKSAGDAFHHTEAETETDKDARAILEKNVRMNKEGVTNEIDGLYHGQAAYRNHVEKRESQIGGNKHTGTQGPIRAPTFLRATCRFDYQPDICKDYKETGFCGFGDSCKFLHDRADYKSGWQMEREFEEKEKKRKEREALGEWAEEGGGGEEEEEYLVESDEELPFACFICRQGFRDPVVTHCGHYFCQDCAKDHYKTSPRCAACGKQTSGVFNRAIRLLEKMKKKGLVTEKPGDSGGGGGGGGGDGGEDGDYEIREEGAELTDTKVVRKSVGSWSTVKDGK